MASDSDSTSTVTSDTETVTGVDENCFNCYICTLDQPKHNLVHLYACNHELCIACLEGILATHTPRWRVFGNGAPCCPFCRTPFLFGLGRIIDIEMAGMIFHTYIRWRQQKPTNDMSFYSVCQDVKCPKRFLINRKCNCSTKTRYVYLHSRQRFLAFM